MSTVKATWKNGQVLLDGPADWPDGRRLVVTEEKAAEVEFLTEDDQADDPESVERWIEELRALPVPTMTPEQEAELLAWRAKAREFNLEAVRRQMAEGIS
ncbi:MAG TPA: hypothetical protein VMS17_16910 [Gemmataceae bacterium]|nr:hypothetical protein [Gemmataceae bacterium]